MIDRASAGISDPAEVFAVSLRISGRLGWTHPDIAGFITGAGLDALDAPGGLAPRALRDIQAGQAAGRFTVPDAEIALSAVAGGLLGLLRPASGIPNGSTRAPSTSSPRPSCACSASPPPKPDALPPSHSRTLAPGNRDRDTPGRLNGLLTFCKDSTWRFGLCCRHWNVSRSAAVR